MKQLLYTALMVFSIALNSEVVSFAKNKVFSNEPKATMKNEEVTAVANTDKYRKPSFLFNDKAGNAFYDRESNEPIRFSIPVLPSDLSEGMEDEVKSKLAKYSLKKTMLFVKQNGITEFLRQCTKTTRI